ncbi:MAG TPA: CDP-alcohol phosphatidyltransferase family protein [Solirubrobacteraceae bacterium]|nr:CDP-alcohol phosphatidyltransferase family protein [Solirubrobacteraceae bacterium]
MEAKQAASAPWTRPTAVHVGPATGLIAQVLLLAALAGAIGLSGGHLSHAGWIVGISCGVVMNAALARGLSHYGSDGLSPADWVTLARGTLVGGVAALVADSLVQPVQVKTLVSLAALALVLDAIDGWVARRTRTAALGARFDGEVDALLILVLSVYVSRSAGAWVLAIGGARYAFGAGELSLPWMRASLPPRFWRKVVAATQGIVLTVAASGVLSPALTTAALIGALILLAESFGHDVLWLRRHRPGMHVLARAGAGPALDPPNGDTSDPSHGPVRRTIAIIFTVLAALVVWAILVAPDQPGLFTLGRFARLPLEGLVLVALALALPPRGRRILAVIVGTALTLLVVLKVINYQMFSLYDRPYDPLGDTSQLGNGIETLRSLVGGTETKLIEVGAIAGTIGLVVVLTLAMLRLTRVAGENRRWALRAVAGLGAVWALCWAFGAQLISHTPIASTLSASLVVDEVNALRADIHDRSVFAAQIRHDPQRNIPTNQLLTSLRGKDVLLVFVEAYGQQAVEGRSFSPEVDAALAEGDRRLASAGFSSRSGFLTSATYGGISWLAHSSLQAGLWVKNQDRYNQLISAKRFTLAEAFKRAGWRTVDDDPSNDRPWPQGKAFYHFDQIYNRYQVGYHGPTFTYASMPDQYIFSALQRLELSKANRKPLFAEVDTVSSHMPWNRIPVQVGWNQVGNGSIYNKIPMIHETGAFWSNPKRVQAAYGTSVVYALNTLTSFVQHYGNKNTVMIVLGDHQPLPIVSGTNSNHDVPISIIAHDPNVLKQIGSWGWNAGLKPSPNAPVWPMNAFRNKFLAAFDSHSTTP